MKYIKVYNNEEDYHALKETHDYPAFAYTKDTDKVWHWVAPYINCVGYEMQFEEDEMGSERRIQPMMTIATTPQTDSPAPASMTSEEFPYDWIEKITINDEEIDLSIIKSNNGRLHYIITSTTMTVMTYLTKDWWEKYSPYLSRFDNGEINSAYILRADNASKLLLGQLDTSLVTSMHYLFIRSESGSMDVLDLSTWDTSNVVNMENMFTQYMEYPYLNVEEIKLPENFGKNCERMWATFSNCPQLTKINLENVNTRACQTMEWLFSGDESITDIDLRTWSFENVENMSKMFQGCHNLTAVTITDSIRSGIDVSDMFTYVETYGKFYSNYINNYDHIIEQLPSTWQVVPLFGNELGIYFHKHNIPYNKTYNCTSWDIDNLLWDQVSNNAAPANLDDNSDYSESDSFDISNPIICLPINGRLEPITHLTYKYNETDTTWYEKFVATFDSCTLTYECKSSAHDVWETKDDWFGTVHFQTNEPTILSYDVADWFKDCEELPEFGKTYNLAYSGSFVKECIENFVNNYTDFFGEDYYCWGLTFNNHYLNGYNIYTESNRISLYFSDGEVQINYDENTISIYNQEE